MKLSYLFIKKHDKDTQNLFNLLLINERIEPFAKTLTSYFL